ncbi:hypothetical protein B5X24_HaOG209044, partial [Helicoverpa armigera]
LYHPAISEPSVAVHPNKQALLTFWHAVSVDCPENVQLAVANQRLTKHIAFNYILADHEDGEVVAYNRAMLPPYYALLRLCCRRSSAFARSLAQHQNIHWAFRNIAPHAHLYPGAADELLRLARILAARGGSTGNNGSTSSGNNSGNGASSGSESADGREAAAFRRSTLSAYLQGEHIGLNGRTCWTTLISAFCTLVENEDDRLYVVYNGGLQMTFEALHSLHAVYVEGGGAGGSAGAIRAELTAALRWARALCRTLRTRRDAKEARALLLACKDWPECARRLLTMLNLHHRHNHLRDAALGVLREVVLIGGGAALGALVPLAAGAQCGARARHPHVCARAGDKHDARDKRDLRDKHRLAAAYRPYHKFIGMYAQYFNDLWELYHPAISEPSVAVHPNKQALLTFWHAVSVDCPENVQLAVANQRLTKHIAFNYILADHEDGEVVAYNRAMLPPYYALLRLCCRRSSAFARSLAQHQNIHWAFRNIAPHAHLYPGAADELLRLARILAARGGSTGNNGSTSSGNNSGNGASSGSESADGREAAAFRRSTLSAYLQGEHIGLNGRTCWTTLISAFCTLVENEDDRLYVVYNGGLQMTFEALHSLHAVYVEGGGAGGSAGAIRAELTAALRWARALCRTLRTRRDAKEARALLLACKDWPECARRLLTMLNLHHRHNHLRDAALGEMSFECNTRKLAGSTAALTTLIASFNVPDKVFDSFKGIYLPDKLFCFHRSEDCL